MMKKRLRRALRAAARSMGAAVASMMPVAGMLALGPIGGLAGAGIGSALSAVGSLNLVRLSLFDAGRWKGRWKDRWTARGARGEEADVRRVS